MAASTSRTLQHFHLGYDDSKDTANFGTKGFFYDAYGNVIGMKDAADTSKYGVIDKAWVEYNKGVASLHANIVGLDAKVTEDVVVATVKYGADEADTTVEDIVPDAPEALKKLYELTVADSRELTMPSDAELQELLHGL